MKIKYIDIAVFLTLILCFISVLCFENECESIRNGVLRLHIIANSDTESDQQLKLRVRDAILESNGEIFTSCTDLSSAIKKAESNISIIKQTAESTIAKNGENYNVKAYIGKSYFPTRVYENNITLPAGYYNALKIEIGEAKGKNWWCVMFPAICLGAVTNRENELKTVLSDSEMKVVTSDPRFEIRFWIVEKYQELLHTRNN